MISTDEKTSIQARIRTHPGQPPAPHQPARVEHEYERGGALQYLAAWDVHRGMAFGRTEPKTGIQPFMRLVEQVMSIEQMSAARSNAQLVHTPVHGSWLNQVEVYFSLIQRHVLTPNDFADLEEVATRLVEYEALINSDPSPFNWEFTRHDLQAFLKKLTPHLAA